MIFQDICWSTRLLRQQPQKQQKWYLLNDEAFLFADNPITEKGSAIKSTNIAEATQMLWIKLEYATTKQPQTYGKL